MRCRAPGTRRRSTGRGGARAPTRPGRRRSSPSRRGASPRCAPRSRRTRRRRRSPGRPSSTSRCAAGLVRVLAPVVALELARAAAVDELADGRAGVEQPALGVEFGRRALLARLGADDGQVDPVDRLAQRALGHAEHGVDGGTALALAVALDEVAPEARCGSGGGRAPTPRCRTRSSACCPRRRAAPAWPGCRRSPCRRS